jgi:hypothetical protein
VCGFIPVASIEKEPVRSDPKACRDAGQSVTPKVRRKAFCAEKQTALGGGIALDPGCSVLGEFR